MPTQTTHSDPDCLTTEERRKIKTHVEEAVSERVDQYTTMGELWNLVWDVVTSDPIKGPIAAPYDAKQQVAICALSECVGEHLTQKF